jgi:hypothetical protein
MLVLQHQQKQQRELLSGSLPPPQVQLMLLLLLLLMLLMLLMQIVFPLASTDTYSCRLRCRGSSNLQAFTPVCVICR